jgi:hypothetical protein
MAHSKLIVLLLTLTALTVGSCQSMRAGGNSGAGADVDFSMVMNRDWILSELRTGAGTVVLNSERHVEQGFGNIFTLRFEDDLASGKAMPNTFRGPYTLGDNRAITFGPMATTMMAALMEPAELSERDFLAYMNNVVGWNLVDGNLALTSVAEGDATGTVMIFVPLDN